MINGPVPQGVIVKDLADNTLFKVLCNCSHSHPRRHTQRFVTENPTYFANATPEEAAAYGKGLRYV